MLVRQVGINMATNKFFEMSENEKKLLKELGDEARQKLRDLGWTDAQIDTMSKKAPRKPKAAAKPKGSGRGKK
jgi:mevalonate kinase